MAITGRNPAAKARTRRALAWGLAGGLIAATAMGQTQSHIVFEGPVRSDALGGDRPVRICLPPSYGREPQRRYPVLYVHDGQNAFSTAGTNVAFGWGNWELDLTTARLSAAGRLREVILVAVDASADRYVEYRGFARPYTERQLAELKRPPPAPGDARASQAYARFLVHELKPRIDREYRTLPDAANTGVLGASLGGISSVALAWQHPDVFGLAASLSGSFQIEGRYFLEQVLRPYQGAPKPFRVYLDSGVVDYSGGDDGCRWTTAVATELRRIGWQDGRSLEHYVDAKPLDDAALERAGLRRDKWAEARTSQHNEFYWRLRVGRALEFLFPREPRRPAGRKKRAGAGTAGPPGGAGNRPDSPMRATLPASNPGW